MLKHLEKFLQYQRTRKLSLMTLDIYGRSLRETLGHLAENPEIRNICDVSRKDMDDLAAWAHGLMDKRSGLPLAPSTKAIYIRTLKQYFSWLMRENELLINPASHLVMPGKTRARPQNVLSVDEVHRLLDAAECWTSSGLRDRAVMEVLYSTGIRKRELLHLTLLDLELATGHVRITHGKGNRERVVPLGMRACQSLERYIKRARPLQPGRSDQTGKRKEYILFLTNTGTPMNAGTVDQMLRRRSAMAGIRNVTAHMLRRACATHLCQSGMSIVAIQQILGHSDLETTRGYLKLSTHEAKKTHEMLHPRERMNIGKPGALLKNLPGNCPVNDRTLCQS